MNSSVEPSWTLQNPGSFASIHVKLAPGTAVNCEFDAVVTISQGIELRGFMSGGILGALARIFFTKESFFTTLVENTNTVDPADVMMAPSEPGGIVLHKLNNDNDDLLLTSGSYVACDTSVRVSSKVQTGIGNSLLSGTGFFLLRASGSGCVACGAYGSVHKYTLGVGETRLIDNGHLVAWSSSMKYRVGLAASSNTTMGWTPRLIMNSVTSGEGLMCHFEGPGIIYLQSHKPDPSLSSINRSKQRQQQGNPLGAMIVFALFSLSIFVFFIFFFVSLKGGQYGGGDKTYAQWNRQQQNIGHKSHDNNYYSQNTHGHKRGGEF